MNETEVKETMKKAYGMLLSCDIAIEQLNGNGHQFDYCTDSTLADITDMLVRRIKSISTKVYQE